DAVYVERLTTASMTTPFDEGGRWASLAVTLAESTDTETAADRDAAMVRRVVVDVGTAASDRTWRGVGAALTDASVELIADRPDAIAALFDPSIPGGAGLDLV